MSGKIIKVAVVCVVILSLGISFKPLFKYGIFFCGAEDTNNNNVQEAAQIPPAAAPEAATPAAGAPAGKYDFSDSSNWNLTVSAWECLAQKDFEGVFAYAYKCLELYEAKAKELAPRMKTFSRSGHEDDFAVVNDVATSRYIMGEAYMKLDRTSDAVKEFEYIIANYPYAQCWDPKGWFWKVAEVSKKNVDKIGKAEKPEGTPQ